MDGEDIIEKLGISMRGKIISIIEENGYISRDEFTEIYIDIMLELMIDENAKEGLKTALRMFPDMAIKIFANAANLEYIEKDKILKMKNEKID